ncbi:MAG: VCBS repeat-containing protein [Bacteroidales bacterium]|nr:VCBS repeat-containing protein [Bacteroidales bacterium]
MTSNQSGIEFTNQIHEDSIYNYFNYPYIYNGGGIGVGDINNDGLPDLYFTGNQVQDELYLNEGNLSFRRITIEAGIKHSDGSWHTGVLMWDANADGFLDIYVCRSGKSDSPDIRKNLLYINNRDETFTESADIYGLDDNGYSTQAYPFDYDKDGNLDLYVVNHRVDFIKNSYYDFEDDKIIDYSSSDHLYRNNGNNTFSEVSIEAGIQNKAWGLSASVGDFNNDGWEDIYVANDFHQPDFLYINNRDGSFSENLKAYFKHTSFYSMGSDLADMNNDGLADLIVLDMVSESHLRSKRMMASMNTDNFRTLVENGYHYQYMINTLQLNNGIGPFSEIGQLAGISKTDWSWAPLLADFDNDGWKDLFVTNGIKKDVTDNDFRISMEKELKEKGSMSWKKATQALPSATIPNYIFQNSHKLKFKNQTMEWGISEPINSNGVAYADLDLDGDLDVIVNNMEAPSNIYQNLKQETEASNFISIRLNGPSSNPFAVGSKVKIYSAKQMQMLSLYPSRGFQSSVEYMLHFGIASNCQIDSLIIEWPDGFVQKMGNIQVNQMLEIEYDSNEFYTSPINSKAKIGLFIDYTKNLGVNVRHIENDFDDFTEEVLLPHKQSELGPWLAAGDINQDGLEDFYLGGAYLQTGKLFLQQTKGTFILAPSQPWSAEIEFEDLDCLFFDADQDADLDLYIVSGGAEYYQNDPHLQDRLYINDGKGNFARDTKALPEMWVSGLSVSPGDFDQDGDIDLFVGGRLVPGLYPLAPRSFLLENNNGIFRDVTEIYAPSLTNPGLVSDALFTDVDGDDDPDLLVIGEWMPVSLYENQNGRFTNITNEMGLSESSGWWSRIAPVDWDLDGDTDYIIGNIGENNKFKPGEDRPLYVYLNDFDHNGSVDMYLAKESNNVKLPVRGRECSSLQLPGIVEKFPTYNDFGLAQLEDILGPEEMAKAYVLESKVFSSCILMNDNGNLHLHPLPAEAQFSQLNGIITEDFNADGFPDLLIAGNNFGTEPETARYDASNGALFFNDTKGGFNYVPVLQSGFLATGNVKSLLKIDLGNSKNKSIILVGNNNGPLGGFIYQTIP